MNVPAWRRCCSNLSVVLLTVPLAGSSADSTKIRILCPDGRAADAATVVILPSREVRPYLPFFFVGNVNPPPPLNGQQYHAGADGVVSIPASSPHQGIVVLHAEGYAEVNPDTWLRGGDVKLLPWARIDGVLMIGKRPGAGQTVRAQVPFRMSGALDSHVFYIIQSVADADGHFVLEHIPPVGPAQIGRAVGGNVTQQQEVEIQPGQTARVVVGGKGRPIVGRLEMPAELAGQHDWSCSGNISCQLDAPQKPMPEQVRNGSAQERKTWTAEFLKTDAGKAYLAAAQKALEGFRSYPMEIAPDGGFRIEDVAAGSYELATHVFRQETGADPRIPAYQQLASGGCQIIVPPMPDGRSDAPLQIGPIVLQLDHIALVGGLAPDFSAPTLDGKTLKLSEFRGKYVLLDFWATDCTPCIEEMPNLKATQQKFGNSGRLTIIGLSLDDKPSVAASYVQKNQIDWKQAWIGGDTGNQVIENYPANGIPAIWLIGPDGKIIAENLRGDAIQTTIAANLNH